VIATTVKVAGIRTSDVKAEELEGVRVWASQYEMVTIFTVNQTIQKHCTLNYIQR
jgi:hypothetical protein